jgi:hypothetical protein
VVTDKAPVYPRVLDDLVPAAWHHVEQYDRDPRSGRTRELAASSWIKRPAAPCDRPGGSFVKR